MTNASLLIPAGAFIVLFAVHRWARRGRVVDDHWVCRRCQYDLTGRAVGVYRCPECGADLLRRRAVRRGNRRPRAGLRAVSLVAMVAALGCLAWNAASWGRRVGWNTIKPNWLLVREATGPDGRSVPDALDHLAYRIGQSTVSADQVGRLVDVGLQRQADRSKPWEARWGRVIEAAHAAGGTTADQWRAYREQSVAVRLAFRPQVVRGTRLPLHANARVDRTWSLRDENLTALVERVTFGKVDLPPVEDVFEDRTDDPRRIYVSPESGGWQALQGLHVSTAPVDRAGLANGTYPVTARVRVVADLGRGKAAAPPPGSHRAVDVGGPVALVDVEPRPPTAARPGSRPSLQGAFAVTVRHDPHGLTYTSRGSAKRFDSFSRRTQSTGSNGWLVKVAVATRDKQTPANVSYRVWLSVDGHDYDVGSFSSIYGDGGGSWEFGVGGVVRTEGVATVRLVPEWAFEARSVDQGPIWDETLLYEKLPVDQ